MTVTALEADILHTRARLHANLEAIAAKLEPARVAQQAQTALMRRLAFVARAKPAAAAAMAFGLGLILAAVRRRFYSHDAKGGFA